MKKLNKVNALAFCFGVFTFISKINILNVKNRVKTLYNFSRIKYNLHTAYIALAN